MSTILVATDFSKASRNAALYAMEIGKRLNASVILFNAVWLAPLDSEINSSISAADLKTQNYNRLKLESLIIDPDQEIVEVICVEGDIADLIMKVASVHKVEFVVVGSKGRSTDFREIFGSTVNDLIGYLEIPLFVIPESCHYSYRPYNVLPVQNNGISQHVTQKLFIARAGKNKNRKCNGTAHRTMRQEKFVLTVPKIDEESPFNEMEENENGPEYTRINTPHNQEWVERYLISNEPGEMIYRVRYPVLILPPVKARTHLNYEIEKAYQQNSIH